jgi:hypothetical protein
MHGVKVDQGPGCREGGNNSNSRVAKGRDDLFVINGSTSISSEIVVDDLFGLLGRDLVRGDVIAVCIIPFKNKAGIIQSLL